MDDPVLGQMVVSWEQATNLIGESNRGVSGSALFIQMRSLGSLQDSPCSTMHHTRHY